MDPCGSSTTPAAERFKLAVSATAAQGHDRQLRLDAPVAAAVAVVHSHPRRRLLERFDGAEPLVDTTPEERSSAATAAATASSSDGRMRGPLSKSCTFVPNAWNIEAICTPVLPAPMTSIDAGTAVNPQTLLCVLVSSMPGTASSTAHTPGADDELLRFAAGVRARSRSLFGPTKRAGPTVLVDRHAERVDPLAQRRVRADVADDLAHASEQLVVLHARARRR